MFIQKNISNPLLEFTCKRLKLDGFHGYLFKRIDDQHSSALADYKLFSINDDNELLGGPLPSDPDSQGIDLDSDPAWRMFPTQQDVLTVHATIVECLRDYGRRVLIVVNNGFGSEELAVRFERAVAAVGIDIERYFSDEPGEWPSQFDPPITRKEMDKLRELTRIANGD